MQNSVVGLISSIPNALPPGVPSNCVDYTSQFQITSPVNCTGSYSGSWQAGGWIVNRSSAAVWTFVLQSNPADKVGFAASQCWMVLQITRDVGGGGSLGRTVTFQKRSGTGTVVQTIITSSITTAVIGTVQQTYSAIGALTPLGDRFWLTNNSINQAISQFRVVFIGFVP